MTDIRRTRISGRDFRYANIGNEQSTQINYHGTEDRTAAIAALRTALDEHGERVVALGQDADERAALRHEITATRRALAAEEPDGTAVRIRWQAVLAILGTTLALNADVAQISQFVMDLFGR